jgi:F0F1-type ATP synthase assembly protein I
MSQDTKNFAKQLAYASSVGFEMVLALFGGLLLGMWLDKQLGTGHILALLFFVIGAILGLRNIYVIIKKYFPDEGEDIQRRIKSESHRKRPPPKKN